MRDVTGVNLVRLTQAAYNLSRPQGLGFLHFTPEPLTDAEAQEIVDRWKDHPLNALHLDYVRGRAVKLIVRRTPDGRLTVDDDWYDHTSAEYAKLWEAVGLPVT